MTDCDTVSQTDSRGGDILATWRKCHPSSLRSHMQLFPEGGYVILGKQWKTRRNEDEKALL